ncbi:hypothetical protein BMS3Bbin04_01923 [bacterium BMS3Bbin04]|nr:hypothetical protein BMS3Bbin04_01923 [bacterium BMS3Bbin04]
MVEVFSDRIEINNPGAPLVDTDRFLDSPPKSRNEVMASLMRRIGICEERGSGIDKVVSEVEAHQLPAPKFEAVGEATRVFLYSEQPLNKMTKQDRVRAVYLHACLRYVQNDFMTNTTLRDRFGIEEHNRSKASRLIKEALGENAIRPHDPTAAPRMMRYLPNWD